MAMRKKELIKQLSGKTVRYADCIPSSPGYAIREIGVDTFSMEHGFRWTDCLLASPDITKSGIPIPDDMAGSITDVQKKLVLCNMGKFGLGVFLMPGVSPIMPGTVVGIYSGRGRGGLLRGQLNAMEYIERGVDCMKSELDFMDAETKQRASIILNLAISLGQSASSLTPIDFNARLTSVAAAMQKFIEVDHKDLFADDYVMDLSVQAKDNRFPIITAKRSGNITRFIQDLPGNDELRGIKGLSSSDLARIATANLIIRPRPIGRGCYFVELVCIKQINPGEQLGFSYGSGYWAERKIQRAVFDQQGGEIGYFDGQCIHMIENKVSPKVLRIF